MPVDEINRGIALANHSTLLQLKNAAYTQIYQRFMQIQSELDSIKQENHRLLSEKDAYL